MLYKLSRRGFLGGAAAAAGSLTAMATLAACGKKDATASLSCTDETKLDQAAKTMRSAVKYVDRTTDPAKRCDGCVQFTPPPSPGSCGGCKVVQGPIHPAGDCTLWVAKA